MLFGKIYRICQRGLKLKRLQNRYYQQRSLLLLLPLVVFALLTWILDPRTTPDLAPTLRELLLSSVRIVFPGLFALTLVLLVPLNKRAGQVTITVFSYIVLVCIIAKTKPELLHNLSICTFAASSSVLAMLPASQLFEDTTPSRQQNSSINVLTALILPYLVLIGTSVILRQIQSFTEFSFSSSFGESFLSFIYAPIFLIMQTLGHHEFILRLAQINYQPDFLNAFINSILISNLISLPTVLIVRSFFNNQSLRLFLTFLAAIATMTASIGGCVSLISLLLMIFLPGTFVLFLLNSVVLCLLSYFMQLPALTLVSNLYSPDTNMLSSHLGGFKSTHLYLFLFAFIMPVCYVIISIMFKKEHTQLIKQRRTLNRSGFTANNKNTPDLCIIAILRSIGGLSNIQSITRHQSYVFLQIRDPEIINVSALNAICNKKPNYDRINKIYYCDFGENAEFIAKRLSLLSENEFFVTEKEVPLTPSFAIKAMPNIHSL